MNPKHLALSVIFAFLLTACSSSGGGAKNQDFTKWTELTPSLTKLNFTGTTVTSTWKNPTGFINEISPPTYDSTATAKLTYEGKQLIKIELEDGTNTLSWEKASNDTISDEGQFLAISSQDGKNKAVLADSIQLAHEYQTYGAWLTGIDEANGTVGALTIGSVTATADIPSSGTHTFTGTLLGVYVDAAGSDAHRVTADTSIGVDFAARSLTFSSTNSTMVNLRTDASAANNDLNLSGTINYASNTNLFFGNLTAAGGMSGSTQGFFYGPSAEEVGGGFQLSGSGVERFTGAYGAKR